MIKQRFIIDYSYDASRKIPRKFVVRGRGPYAGIISRAMKHKWSFSQTTEVVQKKK